MVNDPEGSGRDHFCSSHCAIDRYPNDRVEYYNPARPSDNNHSGLRQENSDLRQQLTAVQKQLAEVLVELKKLKGGKQSEKLSQQIAQNRKIIKENENVSESEIRDQIKKSEALMNELNTATGTQNDRSNEGHGSLPYVIGGSVILALAGIVGYFWLKTNKIKKNKRK
jgi:hypothetical protein